MATKSKLILLEKLNRLSHKNRKVFEKRLEVLCAEQKRRNEERAAGTPSKLPQEAA